MMRKAGLVSGNLPTFEKLFNSARSGWQAGTVYSSETKWSQSSLFDDIYDGEIWHGFYSVGSSLEISRFQYVDGALTKTRLGTWRPSGSTAYTTSIDSGGIGLTADQGVYSYHLAVIKFRTGWVTIEKMLQQASIGTIKSYYDSSYTNSNSDLAVEKSSITGRSGAYYTAFTVYTTGSVLQRLWAGGSAATPSAAPLMGQVNDGSGTASTWLTTRSPFRTYTSSDVDYCVPSIDGSANARVKSYTLKYFTETW